METTSLSPHFRTKSLQSKEWIFRRKMVTQKICEGVISEPVHSIAKEMLRLHHSVQDGNPITLLSVCGPFTTADNLEYEPFLICSKPFGPKNLTLWSWLVCSVTSGKAKRNSSWKMAAIGKNSSWQIPYRAYVLHSRLQMTSNMNPLWFAWSHSDQKTGHCDHGWFVLWHQEGRNATRVGRW